MYYPMKKLVFFSILFINFSIFAQERTDIFPIVKSIDEQEVVISANKVQENKENVAQKVTIISQKALEKDNSQNSADLLSNTGQVLVQKSQQGGGSPILRGFEASRVLLMIDGVRMNNLIYRSGHLQNVITIDNAMLNRVEVLYGPSSTIYGSDALGGVMHFYTKNPSYATSEKSLNFKGNAYARYSSANNETTEHIDLNFGGKKVAFLTSFTYSNFGDLRAGGNYNKKYPDFGKSLYYAERINGKDSMVQNSNPNVQARSGYKQWGFMQKIAYQQNDHISHSLNIQLSNSSNINRYDRLTEMSGGKLKFADWYYGPQKRNMFAYDFNNTHSDGGIHFGLNYQQIEESRHTRRFNSSNLTHRIEKVEVIGMNLDWNKKVNKHEIRVGLDAQYNNLKSTANAENITTNVISPLDTRYPDGKNTLLNTALYATHTWKISPKLVLNDGIRLSYISLNSTFKDTTFFAFPFKGVTQNHLAPNANIALIYKPLANTQVSWLTSTGFRAPNVDDLSKVFESAAGMIIVPNAKLKAERTFNNELSFTQKVSDKFRFEATGFYTSFYNAIVTDKFQYEGQDSVVYDGVKSQVMANQNKGRARIFGASAGVSAEFIKGWLFRSTLTYTKGQIMGDTLSPLDHIPPIFGKTSLTYQGKRWEIETFANYNGAKKIKDYFLNGEDNEQYATPDGMPAWWTLNVRARYEFEKYLEFQAGVDNIFDAHYRVFASGMSGAGRNVWVRLGAKF